MRCAQCKTVLQDDPDPIKREPCHIYGSTERAIEENFEAALTLRTSIAMKAKSPGERRPFMEQKSGDDLHRKTGRWSKLIRVIDRRGDRYVERVVDEETGAVLQDVDEPLSQHRGHGSAKPKG